MDKTVLLVGVEGVTKDLAEGLVSDPGYEVLRTGRLDEAKEIVQGQGVDVVVMGLCDAAYIGKHGDNPRIPAMAEMRENGARVIVTDGLEQGGLDERFGIAEGVQYDGFVRDHYDVDDLRGAIAEVLVDYNVLLFDTPPNTRDVAGVLSSQPRYEILRADNVDAARAHLDGGVDVVVMEPRDWDYDDNRAADPRIPLMAEMREGDIGIVVLSGQPRPSLKKDYGITEGAQYDVYLSTPASTKAIRTAVAEVLRM